MAAPTFDSRDVAQNKLLGGIGYLLPFVPFLACPTSKFGRYCANQGLLFWLVLLAVQILFMVIGWVFGWIWVVGGLLHWIGNLVRLAVLALEVYFTYMAMAKGIAKEIPYIGTITLIK